MVDAEWKQMVWGQLGGAIEVTSSPGEGASFTVRLPHIDPEAMLASIKSKEYTKESTS